ncbi:MAG: energy-coupling factor transporter ATPase [Candidatus Faecivicinus sp.]|nr:energy-coupling factor transporter ATPase [Candidatus Faecivicinus sp.]
MPNTVLRAQNVRFQYDDSSAYAVDGVSLEAGEGEFLAILGRNGSGKSTFAKLLNALLLPTEGTVEVCGIVARDDESAYAVRRSCGMVFQNPDNQIVATIVEEDCAFGLENLGVEPEEIRARVDETLAEVGMSAFAKTSPSMLSGGQKQRVAIAGVLAMRPKIIVFDESTAMLDPVGRRDVLEIARRLNREEKITVIWITHFMDEVVCADRVIVMDKGKIALQGAPREVFKQGDAIRALGLDIPEMMRLSAMLRSDGVSGIRDAMTVEEMAEELCRLKSRA